MNVQQGEGLLMRRTSTWLIALWIGVCSASGQEATSADDVRKGHQLAIMVCSFCHVAAPDQAHMPILNPPAPSFDSVAQRTDISVDWLEKFITTTRGLDNPSGMPNPSLRDYQVKQVVAYLLSLRKQVCAQLRGHPDPRTATAEGANMWLCSAAVV